eukprot:64371-Pleurochrysis_carterae.AAC.1
MPAAIHLGCLLYTPAVSRVVAFASITAVKAKIFDAALFCTNSRAATVFAALAAVVACLRQPSVPSKLQRSSLLRHAVHSRRVRVATSTTQALYKPEAPHLLSYVRSHITRVIDAAVGTSGRTPRKLHAA